jgi:hypothetical protein
MTLVWVRHNLSQALLGAFYGISQPTVSRIITRLRELITRAANQGMSGLADTEPGQRLLLDGSLLPTGNRAGQQGEGLYNGKRHKAGMNVQVICDRWGRLVEVSDPTPGSMHDARSFTETGLDRLLADRSVLADLGFLGCGVATPVRKPPGGKLCELEKATNRAYASAPAPVERTIALLKQWRVVGRGSTASLASDTPISATFDDEPNLTSSPTRTPNQPPFPPSDQFPLDRPRAATRPSGVHRLSPTVKQTKRVVRGFPHLHCVARGRSLAPSPVKSPESDDMSAKWPGLGRKVSRGTADTPSDLRG